ncbi:NAD(P)/FAD-dependent oxidoreductase [Chloroflexota bacterium]
MSEYDVIIIGGGPAGLAVGLYLSRGKHRTILLDKESFGGIIKDVEWIENYPGFAEGVSGAHLASEMVTQATKYGLQIEQAEVVGIELYTSSRWVQCTGGAGYSATVVIIAGGARPIKLNVPGEEVLQGKGVINCALCDGGQFAGRVVAVCGGGDAGVTEALYLTKLASKVILIEAEPLLTATAVLQDRASVNPKLEIRCGAKVEKIVGDSHVEAIEFLEAASGRRETLKVDGVLVHVGLEANTSYLKGVVPLDSQGQIIVNDRMETEVPCVLAAGDIRSGSLRQIVTAVGDGATAAISAERLLQELS